MLHLLVTTKTLNHEEASAQQEAVLGNVIEIHTRFHATCYMISCFFSITIYGLLAQWRHYSILN